MRMLLHGIVLAALLAGCSASTPPSETAAGMGPGSVNCENQTKARHGEGSIDCQYGY